jgi:hypothetical protein
LKKERKKERAKRECKDGPLPPPVASHPRTRTSALSLSLFSLSSFVLIHRVLSRRMLIKRARDDDEKHTKGKRKNIIIAKEEEEEEKKKQRDTTNNALVYPIAERVHQVAPESGDATEQRSVSRRSDFCLRGFFFAAHLMGFLL